MHYSTRLRYLTLALSALGALLLVGASQAEKAAPDAIRPRGPEDLRWVETTFARMQHSGPFSQLVALFGSKPRANGDFTQVKPHSPLFAEVLLHDAKEKDGARTQTVTVRYAAGKQPSISTFERRFGRAKRTPPMADGHGRNVRWTKIIYLGKPRLKKGSGRIILKLAGGSNAKRAREVTLDLYIE